MRQGRAFPSLYCFLFYILICRHIILDDFADVPGDVLYLLQRYRALAVYHESGPLLPHEVGAGLVAVQHGAIGSLAGSVSYDSLHRRPPPGPRLPRCTLAAIVFRLSHSLSGLILPIPVSHEDGFPPLDIVII